jgi:TonB family protein
MFSAMAAAIQSDWVGQIVDGRFSLLEWLGGSDHSGVFLTELPGTPPQKAAIRLIPHEGGLGPRIAFATDASRTHPHLVRVLQSGRCEIDGAPFIYVVTEFADEVLSGILPGRPLTPDEVKEMLGPILDGLSNLHEHRLVHGRLKPSNILVVNDRLKLSADSVQLAGTASAAPLSIYDAPERAAGSISPASDMWSLGVTIVEALTQRAPDWNPSTNPATTNVDPHIPDSIPQPFGAIAAACLRVNPARRATVNELRGRLGLAVPVFTPPAVRNSPLTEERESSGRPWMMVLVVVALLLAAMVAFIWWHAQTPPATQQSSEQQTAQPATPAPAVTAPQPQPVAPQQPAVDQPPPLPSAVAPPQGSGEVKGAVSQRVMPEIPTSASNSIRGTVNVRVRVNVSPTGDVTNADFDSAGPSKYFAKAAMDAARQWKFRPAQANGQPVASIWILQFAFTPGNTAVIPEQTAP